MYKSKQTEYFGEKEVSLDQSRMKRIASSLEFDNESVERITNKVYDGMDVRKKGVLTKEDLRAWTKAILTKKHPGVPFNEENFQKGFAMLDQTKDGKITIEDIRQITLNKVKEENLYFNS